MTIQEFCDKHDACQDGHKWALANCKTMQDVWDTARSEWLVWVATREGVLDEKALRLFACWCVRQIWHFLTDERSRNAVVVAERYANGEATEQELDAARDAARDAAWDAASDAAWYAAWDAARDAARYAARDATSAVAWYAAWYAARAAAWDAASDAAWDAQAAYLREHYQPFIVAAGGEGK